eukprot:GILI01015925.1.p1 GENE.GILI01015925.1~~GILI01015925.1.p1  ORF type:complete len:205 (+),score=27.31 GILI01015925.1:79-693(+)
MSEDETVVKSEIPMTHVESSSKSGGCCWRCCTSNSFTRLFRGDGIDEEKMDEAVNALALVCALLLTIPFGIIPNLNMDYWEKVVELSKNCPQYDYTHARFIFVGSLGWSVYLSTSGLALATFYYVLKPKDFEKWYKTRGKYLLILLILATIASLVVLLVVFGHLFAYYNVNYAQYCTTIVDGWFTASTATYIGLFVIISIVLMW